MWLCVQAYDIQVADTKLTQNITQTFSQLVNSTIDWGANITFVNLPAELNQRSGAQYTIASDGTLDAFNPFLGPWFNGTVSLNNGSSSPSSDVIQAICNATSTDLDVWIKYIALSVTNALRVFTPASNDMYNGTGYQTGSSSTLATAGSPVQAWKGSPPAPLLLDVDLDIRRSADGRMDTSNGLQESVGKTKVVMKSDQNGNWAFKAA
ncbi:MAG: hypothetical protein ALECFALPRED_007009 [Alectoria fallacina]|uniref:Uncharacterized protein n=1 Tax=Alectoria fallacina TaxID=1903189 RepID=A0A8H3G8U9_9LECA|nr:MAG: hypothetical protein ALECFALPRED_007009 [Alectoria fallacina]